MNKTPPTTDLQNQLPEPAGEYRPVRYVEHFFSVTDDEDLFRSSMYDTIARMESLCGHRLSNLAHRHTISPTSTNYWNDRPLIVGINAKTAIMIETNPYLSVEEVAELVEEGLPAFAEWLPEYAEGREVLCARIFQLGRTNAKAVRAALNAGIYAICAPPDGGDLLQIKHENQLTLLQEKYGIMPYDITPLPS